MIDLEGTPCRIIPPGRRSLTGKLPLKGRLVGFESSLERDMLVLLDADRDVVRVLEQPVIIPYVSAGGRRTAYVPDYLATRRGGPGDLIEVKFRDELRARWLDLRSRLRAAVAYARSAGLRFRIMDENRIRTPLLANLTFLKRYPAARGYDDAREAHLVATLERLGTATPRAVIEAAYRTDDNRLRAIPALWGLVGAGRIGADLRAPLTMRTPLRVAPGAESAWPGPYSYDHPLGEAVYRRNGLAPPERRHLSGTPCLGDGDLATRHETAAPRR